MKTVKDLDASIFTFEIIKMRIIRNEVVRITSYSARQNVIVVGVLYDYRLNLLWCDTNLLSVDHNVGNEFNCELLVDSQFVEFPNNLIQNRFRNQEREFTGAPALD